jgi:outer membrane protein assembly factor BamB
MALARFIPGMIEDGPSMIWIASAFGPFLIGLLIVFWWLFLSRATILEKFVGLIAIILFVFLITMIADPTVRGPLVTVMMIPMCFTGFALGLIAFAKRPPWSRLWPALVLALLGAAFSALVRTDGVWGNFAFGIDWRWKQSSEEQFLHERDKQVKKDQVESKAVSFRNAEWPGFRGPLGESTQRGTKFSSDWQANPPREIWRMRVGPAWSSFAVAGDYLVTQEQRGDKESVVCYSSLDGSEVWEHTITARFFEALGGLGPRATPTLTDDSVFAMGADGNLLKLSATGGNALWKVDLKKDFDCSPPMWGFASSPCVAQDLVVVYVGGSENHDVAAFDTETGKLRWTAAAGKASYGSIQPLTLDGTEYLSILSEHGLHVFDVRSGEEVLRHTWEHTGYRALQPRLVNDNKVLIPTGLGTGTRLISIDKQADKLASKELWTTRRMKPDFSDLVTLDGYVYGIDNAILSCIRLSDGELMWKGGRYGKGQILLLFDSKLILVAGEEGELAIVQATPDEFVEAAKIQALSGKTWNHPVVVGKRLYLRNAEEAVCYELATE